MPHKTTHIRTKKLKSNNQIYIGFQVSNLYTNKYLFKQIESSFNFKGLTYYNKLDLPKSILEIIEN